MGLNKQIFDKLIYIECIENDLIGKSYLIFFIIRIKIKYQNLELSHINRSYNYHKKTKEKVFDSKITIRENFMLSLI